MNIEGLIGDLALILMLGAVVTLIFKKLKQPIVLGYIVAGYHEENGDKIKFKDMEDTEPFHVNWSVGAFIYWGETRLGAEYLIGLKEGSEGTFGVSLGWRMDW